MRKSVSILGTRGVPAAHGGFETFAEHLALFLVKKGWAVTVYCQEDSPARDIREDEWRGVRRVIIPVSGAGALGTIKFDWRSVMHAMKAGHSPVLTLGYNTAAFCFPYRLLGIVNVINMDGLEWKRDKWRFHERAWLWLNERLGCWLGNHLVADHPQIKVHLETRVASKKITMIPYGADEVLAADEAPVRALGLEPGRYLTVVARPEPENSLLEIVQGFSKAKRGYQLVVLGNYQQGNAYHQAVKNAASDEVIFPGAIYDKSVVQSLRFHAAAYVHGHQVGGTNPSLVEALGAGNAVIAHDNRFNRWVAGASARYFLDAADFDLRISELLAVDDTDALNGMRKGARARFHEAFTWPDVLAQYERLLASCVASLSDDQE